MDRLGENFRNWQPKSGFAVENVARFYAKNFGIADIDIVETPWLAEWVKRHHNRLRRSETSCRWFWVDEETNKPQIGQ